MRQLRIISVFIFVFLFSAAIIGRLAYLQIVKADFYNALSEGFQISSQENQKARGEIYLSNKEPVAINWGWPLVFASTPKVDDIENTAKSLSQTLNISQDLVLEKLGKDTLFSLIKNKLTQEEVGELKKLDLSGIYITEEQGRYYPKEDFASKITGFVGANSEGQYGVEGYYNNDLNKGENLNLTIDYNIQFTAEKLLKKAKDDLNIEGGQIIVLEPSSGKILAMADFPNFNPNQYVEYAKSGDLEIFQNGATQKLYEPGSVFKPITMAGALAEEKITPQTTYIDGGKLKIGGDTIYNYDGRVWGVKTMTEVLERSINTGAVFAENQLGHSLFLEYVKKFGFFEPTGIDLAEVYSENKEVKKGREINFATASFGQGIEVTPIQLARAYCAIANGGKLVTPYLAEGMGDKGENDSLILSSKTASQLTAMLVSVIDNGYAKTAKINGYYIAGKTGTAQVPEGGKYSTEKTIQTFVGFAPAFNPRFLILVKLDNPETKTAEYSAVPVFHELAKYIIDLWQIPPDYDWKSK